MAEFPQFAFSIGRGLAQAVRTDTNVFLLAVGGTLGAFPRTRGLGMALGTFVLLRRADDIAGMFAVKLDQLGYTISANFQIQHHL